MAEEEIKATTEEKNKEALPKNNLKSLRTYKGDIQEMFSKNKTTASSIVVAEQRRKFKTLLNPDGDERKLKNRTYVVFGVGLLLLGIVTLSVVYFYFNGKEQVIVVQKTKALVPFSQEKDFVVDNVSRDQVIATMSTEKRVFRLPVNSILYLNTVKSGQTSANVTKILPLIAPKIPDDFLRALSGKYMFGVYSFDANEPFIILSIDDYAGAFAGMLKWENTIAQDLGQWFEISQNLSGIGFRDEAIKNKDLRVLRDLGGNTLLLYSFIDKNTLIITSNEKIFDALIGKYITNQMSR